MNPNSTKVTNYPNPAISLPNDSNLSNPTLTTKIRSLSTLQLQLFDIISRINQIISLSIAIFILYVLIGSVFALYEGYFALVNLNKPDGKFSLAVGTISSNVYFSINIFNIVKLCSLVKRESQILKEIAKERIYKVKDKNILERLKIFVLQMKHSELKFSCGMCDFDWKIIYGVSLSF